MKKLILFFAAGLAGFAAAAAGWQEVIAHMPLAPGVVLLNRTNAVEVMLRAFQSNDTVKALIFMPGATDEFYMFRRAEAQLTNAASTLLDAVLALTNQTHIRATFRPPALLLHTTEDPLDPLSEIKNPATAKRLQRSPCAPLLAYNDCDWNFMYGAISKRLGAKLKPDHGSSDSRHFYRHSFAGWNLTGWETLEALARAGKSRFTVCRNEVTFEVDMRYLTAPKVETIHR